MQNDLEAKMAEALEGQFFWEKTTLLGEQSNNKMVLEIRRAQRKFFKPKIIAEKPPKKSSEESKKLQEIANKLKFLSEEFEQQLIQRLGAIMELVACAHGVNPEDIKRPTTSKYFKDAKCHYYWAIDRYIKDASLSRMSNLLGRNHTTLLHGKRRFEKIKDSHAEKVASVDEAMQYKPI